jgi:hypothetical protein
MQNSDIMAKRDKKKMIRVAVIGNTSIAEINLALYGSMDPDTEILSGVSKETWELAYPKMRRANNHSGFVMIFGTARNCDGKDFLKFWRNEIVHKDLFIPATVAESGSFPFLKNTGADPKIFDQNGNVHWSDNSYNVDKPKMIGVLEQLCQRIKDLPTLSCEGPVEKERIKKLIDKLSKR